MNSCASSFGLCGREFIRGNCGFQFGVAVLVECEAPAEPGIDARQEPRTPLSRYYKLFPRHRRQVCQFFLDWRVVPWLHAEARGAAREVAKLGRVAEQFRKRHERRKLAAAL